MRTWLSFLLFYCGLEELREGNNGTAKCVKGQECRDREGILQPCTGWVRGSGKVQMIGGQ